MRFLLSRALVAGVLFTSLGTAGFAHHFTGHFDTTNFKTLKGTVTGWTWANPHSWLKVSVSDGKGRTVEWIMELQPPSILKSMGFSGKMLARGDKVEILVAPRKDGTPEGALVRILKRNGQFPGLPDLPLVRSAADAGKAKGVTR